HRALSEHKTLSVSWSHYPALGLGGGRTMLYVSLLNVRLTPNLWNGDSQKSTTIQRKNNSHQFPTRL
ncbi:TPA: hypothetical protein ACIYPD_005395, partial [Escherichia coli]